MKAHHASNQKQLWILRLKKTRNSRIDPWPFLGNLLNFWIHQSQFKYIIQNWCLKSWNFRHSYRFWNFGRGFSMRFHLLWKVPEKSNLCGLSLWFHVQILNTKIIEKRFLNCIEILTNLKTSNKIHHNNLHSNLMDFLRRIFKISKKLVVGQTDIHNEEFHVGWY